MKTLSIIFLISLVATVSSAQVIIIPPASSTPITRYPGYTYYYGDQRNPAQYIYTGDTPRSYASGPTVIIDMSPSSSVYAVPSPEPRNKMVIEHILDWLMPGPALK